MARITASALLLILFAEPALAQITFELPRECLERQVPDPRGCEILARVTRSVSGRSTSGPFE